MGSYFCAGPKARAISRIFLLSVLVGVVTGFGAMAFFYALGFAEHVFLGEIVGYHQDPPEGEKPLFGDSERALVPWLLLLVPALGGLASGILVAWLAPEAGGHGTDAAIWAYHHDRGRVRARIPLVKAVASAITIGTGGSGGREGPIAQIGAGLGSMLASMLRLNASEQRILMAAGMAAGIGAIFHAPLAGALFAAEVLYRRMDLEHEVLVPSFIASIVSYSVFASVFGWRPVFATPADLVFNNAAQLLPYLVLALVVAGAAAFFIKLFHALHNGFERLAIPRFLKPAIGGLVVGAIGLAIYYAHVDSGSAPGRDGGLAVLATGYGVLQRGLEGDPSLTWQLLLLVAFGKMVTTSFSIGSGGSGGVFGPSVVIGGAIGGAVGLVVGEWFPGLGIEPGAFVLVGMAGFFAAAASCPISTMIMVSEMTGNYRLLVPSMLVCILAYLITQGLTLYSSQLDSRLDAPSKMGNMLAAVLRRISVAAALCREGGARREILTVNEDTSLSRIIEQYSVAEQSSFPVVDGDGRLTGIVAGRDIRRAIGEEGVALLVVARDLARHPSTITERDSLLTAIKQMTLDQSDVLVVIDDPVERHPMGTLSRDDILRTYDDTVFSRE